MKKGVDFMAEIELGSAPPISYIKKNIVFDENEYRKDETLADILKKGNIFVEKGQ